MPNINAALGCAQLEQLPDFLAAKRRLFERYRAAFSSLTGVSMVVEPPRGRSNYWLQALLLERPDEALRDVILEATNEAGLMTRPVWTLLNRLEPFQGAPAMALPMAEGLERRLINVPSSARLAM